MRKPIIHSTILALLFLCFAVSYPDVSGQESIRGSWVGEFRITKVWLYLKVHTGEGRERMQMSFDIPLDDVKGFDIQKVRPESSEMRFEIPRDAGTIVFNGEMKEGKGSGDFKFAVNDSACGTKT
jgi:hypothetical protein